MKLILPNGSSAYGAQMGRRNTLPIDVNAPIKLRMEKLRWVDGDYDQWGAYWGNSGGTDIYCAWDYIYYPIDQDFKALIFVRASSRQDAKEKVREVLPNSKFYV